MCTVIVTERARPPRPPTSPRDAATFFSECVCVCVCVYISSFNFQNTLQVVAKYYILGPGIGMREELEGCRGGT